MAATIEPHFRTSTPPDTAPISLEVCGNLSQYLNRQERGGATVVRIEQVRRILAGQEPTN